MSAYIIVDVQVENPEAYEEYKAMVMPTLESFGGRFVVRGGAAHNLEGDWQPGRIVVLEFDSLDRAKAWWDSPEYRPARDLRQSASTARMIVVEGV